jgi:hypothetical protein
MTFIAKYEPQGNEVITILTMEYHNQLAKLKNKLKVIIEKIIDRLITGSRLITLDSTSVFGLLPSAN